jgi:hypothetical protein
MFAGVNLIKGPETVLGPTDHWSGLSLVPVRSNIESMKLLVVDDHPVLRGGLCALLLQIEKDVVVLQAGDAEQGLGRAIEHADLDILISLCREWTAFKP